MAKPVIMIVDDEPQVVNSVERDLRTHYRDEYRIVKALSGKEALEGARELKRRGTPLALFLVDQRMPEMTGTELLAETLKMSPESKKVLLTAYSDTQAAIDSINRVGLDYYLMKPWDPPEINLYPILDDLLDDWKANVEIPYEGIRVAGTLWSANSHTVKDFLARNLIPYRWLDIEQDDQAQDMVRSVSNGEYRLPVIFFPDGSYLIDPSLRDLAIKTGLLGEPSLPSYDLAIIGAGPAGLAAAVYGASEGLKTIMIEKEAAGGQAGTSSRIENYLGFPNGLTGSDLTRRAVAQARKFGAEILTGEEVAGLRADDPYRYIELTNGRVIGSKALLIATGVSVRRLEVPGADELTGAGVYYGAALTEAAYYRDQHVFVVGGGNSAGQAAMFFSRYASQVSILVRTSTLEVSMSQYLIDQINQNPKIEVLTDTEVIEARGNGRLEEICMKNNVTGAVDQLPAAAVFIFIGAVPHTDMVGNLVQRNSAGFILTGPELMRNGKRPRNWTLKRDPFLLETGCPGIFAAGDVRQGSIKRVATAVGEGAMAVALVHQYLKTV
ncbi:MAG: response regulator [Chloroflexi bacterium]|nr:MAG: response regulator [Chloroflexota bacterium]